MPIELRCSQCDTLLRVPDGSEGRETRCPACNTMLRIPGMSASQYPDSQYPDSRYPDSRYPQSGRSDQEANPFSAPATGAEPFTPGTSPFAGVPPVRLDVGDLLGRGWEIFRRSMGICIGGWLIVAVLSVLVLFVGIGLTVGAAAAASGGFNNEEVAVIVALAVAPFALITWGLVYSWLALGWSRLLLQISRSGSGDIGQIFAGGPGVFSYFASGILSILAATAGYAFCFVPGVIIGLMFSQRGWLIADRQLSTFDSLGTSSSITSGHKLNLFLLFLLQGVVGFAMGFIPYVGPLINLLFVQPYFFVVFATTYLTLTGQPSVSYSPAMAASSLQHAMPPQGSAGTNPAGTAPPPDFGS